MAYDCVKIIVVRDGSAFLFSEFGQQPVKPGDVILLGANVLCGSEPEGHITVTTVYLDTDYVLDQVRWQYAGFLQDRLDAQGFADTIYTEPAQILRLGENRASTRRPAKSPEPSEPPRAGPTHLTGRVGSASRLCSAAESEALV